jgi:hypothetical protein
MPSLVSVQFLLLTSILICLLLLTISIHLQARAVQHAEDSSVLATPTDILVFSPQSSVNRKTTWHPSLALVPLLLIILVGRWFTRTTYYDYFLYATLLWPLFAISTTALFAASLTSRALIKSVTQWSARALIQLILLAITLAFGWATITILPHRLANDISALYSGPQHASGQVEATDSIGGRGEIASIVVDGVHYSTYDFAWWRSLHREQTIQFVRDPAHTVAFESSRIGLTPAGGIVSGSIGAVWLWMSGFVMWRFQHAIAAWRSR